MEKVNHPDHYNIEGKKECIEQMLDDYGLEITIIFCLTNSYKYLYRAGYKKDNPEMQDIKKARWYFDFAKSHGMELLENKNICRLREYVSHHLDEIHVS